MDNSYLVNWGAQSVRAVVFTTALDSLRAADVYSSAFGTQPSSFQSAPEGAPFATSVASGTIKGMQASVQMTSGRLDLVLTPEGNRSVPVSRPTVPVIDDTSGALDSIQRAAVVISKRCETTSRLSIVLDLIRPVADVGHGNVEILKTIPYSLNLTSEEDFLLQVNKQKEVNILGNSHENITINRLCRWSVSRIQLITIPFALTSASITMQGAQALCVAQVTLDFNTLPDGINIESSKIVPIIRALCDEIDAVRRRGVEHE
ncbi:MAG: hypothetical protein WA734_15775 [Candidatus Acidiferrales bacterium]